MVLPLWTPSRSKHCFQAISPTYCAGVLLAAVAAPADFGVDR
jgi:hypothetical protein